MVDAAFSLNERLIAYGENKSAWSVAPPLSQLAGKNVDCIMGVVTFVDDAGVHAEQWEMHPHGDEILYVLEGCLRATVDREGIPEQAIVTKGQAFIVPRAHWHRLEVLEAGALLYFTPGAGTELRPHVAHRPTNS